MIEKGRDRRKRIRRTMGWSEFPLALYDCEMKLIKSAWIGTKRKWLTVESMHRSMSVK